MKNLSRLFYVVLISISAMACSAHKTVRLQPSALEIAQLQTIITPSELKDSSTITNTALKVADTLHRKPSFAKLKSVKNVQPVKIIRQNAGKLHEVVMAFKPIQKPTKNYVKQADNDARGIQILITIAVGIILFFLVKWIFGMTFLQALAAVAVFTIAFLLFMGYAALASSGD